MGPNRNDVPAPRRRGWRRRLAVGAGLLLGLLIAAGLAAYFSRWELAHIPEDREALNPARPIPGLAFDVWGEEVSEAEAKVLLASADGRERLSPARGAVAITPALLQEGKAAFYGETFGNEVFMSDVVGILDGPINAWQVAKAIAALGGGGTTNLRVALAEDATVGGRRFARGTVVDTGLDVPRGALSPLGMKVFYDRGEVRAGVTCALCHSAVDPRSGKVVHGAPNPDFNAGLVLALAPNTAAYFAHAEVGPLATFVKDITRRVPTAAGSLDPLPDPQALEDAVDAVLLDWPPGDFDSMIDLKAAATQLPPSFTRGNHPYSFSGLFLAGPFRGLSAQNNNVHGLNSDALTNADAVAAQHGIDRELYLGTLLQNAANPRFRYDPAGGRSPSDFLADVDPTPGTPGVNQVVELPTYPKPTLISPVSLLDSAPGRTVWQQVNAMSAWQDALEPPASRAAADPAATRRGRFVFERAGCARCHAGPYLTNNRIVPVAEVGTEPTRAAALKKARLGPEAVVYAFDAPVPLPADAAVVRVPTGRIDPEQVRLAYAQGDSPGGYKVPALVGLAWTAPYLHDGGVAVGPDADAQLGLPGTLLKGVRPDPASSLRALVDRELRARVVAANRADDALRRVRVEGSGHEFWADAAAGFDADDQRALVDYLLAARPRGRPIRPMPAGPYLEGEPDHAATAE